MSSTLSHVSIVVPSIAAATQKLRDVYGLESGAIEENAAQGVRLCYVAFANCKLELIEPLAPDSAVGRFLGKHPGGGLHHLCIGVADVAQAKSKLQDKGVRVLGGAEKSFNIHGEEIAFIHPADFFGALLELEPEHCEPRPE